VADLFVSINQRKLQKFFSFSKNSDAIFDKYRNMEKRL